LEWKINRRDSVIANVRRLKRSTINGLPSMSFDVYVHTWETDTRPCDFSLCLDTPRGATFADFDLDSTDRLTLRRVSFDGYGCCRTEGVVSQMDAADSCLLTNAVCDNTVNTDPIRNLLRRYFTANSESIWIDALTEHELLDSDHRNL